MNCIFMYNPEGGNGKIKKRIDKIKKILLSKFKSVAVHETTSSLDTVETAKASGSVYDAIIFAGGDGTFNDIVQGVLESGSRPYLGYLPTGTVNDIARNLKISKCWRKALKIILKGYYLDHDVGQINGRYFIYVACVGTFASVSYRTRQKAKRNLGKYAYVLNGIQDFNHPASVNLKLYSKDTCLFSGSTPLFLILNSICAGGVIFNRHGHRNDGTLDVIIVKQVGKGINAIAETMLLGIGADETKHYKIFRLSDFRVEVPDDVIWTLDGEKGETGAMHVKCLNKALKIFTGKIKNKILKNAYEEKNSCT